MKRVAFAVCAVKFLIIAVNAGGGDEDAFIFDRRSEYPILPRDIPLFEESGDWAVACPAQTDAEDDFVSQFSITKKALFVKQIYRKGTKVSKLNISICKNNFQTSIVYKVENSTFQFGYEIYFKKGDLEYFKYYKYEDYKAPQEVVLLKTKFRRKLKFSGIKLGHIVADVIGMDLPKLVLNEVKMDFMWFYLFRVRFDLSKKILELTWHEIQPHSKWSVSEHCENYNLGLEVYEGIDIDALYNNQAKIFENFELPPNICESTDQCLMKWSLVPLDQFGINFLTPLLCSNLPTIPIWRKNVEKMLKKLDKYLLALYQALKEPIHVISGIIGEHKISNKTSKEESTIFLDSETNKIPVPKIIYKAIEYELKNCDSESSCWNSVVIIVHNDPFFKTDDKLCSNEYTKIFGWQEITKDLERNQFDFIYVCRNDKNLQEQLPKLKETVAGDLNLLKFTPSDGGTEINIKIHVDEKFQKLSNKGEDLNLVNNDEKD